MPYDQVITGGFPSPPSRHLRFMRHGAIFEFPYQLRIPSEPSPPPIQDPVNPPENPDVPVREPDPEEPGQI